MVHPTTDNELSRWVTTDIISLYPRDVRILSTPQRRVATDAILLYPRDVTTLVSCYRPISLSSAKDTVIVFALAWMDGLTMSYTGDNRAATMTRGGEAHTGEEKDTDKVLASLRVDDG
jgi:hypothetical protein